MTAYFDQTHDAIREAAAAFREEGKFEPVEVVERTLVFDCLVCSEMPDFPPEFRDQIHDVVLRYGITTLPLGAPPRDFETFDDHEKMLHDLCWHLHSVFHAVVRWYVALESPDGLVPFSADPRTPIRGLYARGEEAMKQKIAARAG